MHVRESDAAHQHGFLGFPRSQLLLNPLQEARVDVVHVLHFWPFLSREHGPLAQSQEWHPLKPHAVNLRALGPLLVSCSHTSTEAMRPRTLRPPKTGACSCSSNHPSWLACTQ